MSLGLKPDTEWFDAMFLAGTATVSVIVAGLAIWKAVELMGRLIWWLGSSIG